MQVKIIFGLMILFCGTFAVLGQENSKHPIDVAMNKCLKTAVATMPRAKCYSTASGAWEKAVAENYQKLLKILAPDMRKILESEQNAWDKYREAREVFVMEKYGKRKGSGYISVRIIELMKPNRDRASDLESRFEN